MISLPGPRRLRKVFDDKVSSQAGLRKVFDDKPTWARAAQDGERQGLAQEQQ